MRRLLKWISLALAGLLGLLVAAAIVIFALASSKLSRTYEVEVAAVAIPNDEAAIARGEHLVRAISGCDGCHGENLGGMVLLDDPAIMTFYRANLTSGAGGEGTRLSDRSGCAPSVMASTRAANRCG